MSKELGGVATPLLTRPTQAVQVMQALAAGMAPPPNPMGAMQAERHMRCGADVASGLMLDAQSTQLFAASVDAWLATGGLTPYQPPLALPPRQEAQLNRRMSALVAQRKPVLPLAHGPGSSPTTQAPLKPVTREPSRDRLHAQARTDLSEWLAGLGERQVAKGDGKLVEGKGVWAAAKEKARGKADPDAYAAAIAAKMTHKSLRPRGPTMTEFFGKAGQPGSRGGHVIGTTASGHPIYASSHSSNSHAVAAHYAGEDTHEHAKDAHPKYSAADHLEAADHHQRAAAQATNAKDRVGAHAMAQAHSFAAMSMKKSHNKRTFHMLNAQAILKSHLSKAGEGSRGGKIIGHTKSGKPVYESDASASSKGRGFHVHSFNEHQSVPHSEGAKRSVETMKQNFHGFSKQDHEEAAHIHRTHADTAGMTSRKKDNHRYAAMAHDDMTKYVK